MEQTKLYEAHLDFTGVTDFGAPLEAVLSGQTPAPPQGARVDVAFDGAAEGKLRGRVKGVDYLNVRADGRVELDIKATIETHDGHRIAFRATGVATARPNEPIADLRESIVLSTSAEPYLWVNGLMPFGIGTVDLANGRVHVEIFS